MTLIAFAIACTSCLLVVHGRPAQTNRTLHFEIDAVSGTGYLVQVPDAGYLVQSAPRAVAGWQKTVTLAAPAALAAAGWVMRSQVSQVVFGQRQAQIPLSKTEGPDALHGCNITWPTWRVVVAFIVLGICTARQRREKISKSVEPHCGDKAAAKLPQVKMFRICTEQPDAEPEPAWRSGTALSALSEDSNLPDSAELFRIHTEEPMSARSHLSSLDEELQFDEAVLRCEDQRVLKSLQLSNAESAGSAGVEVELGTEDYASGREAAAETIVQEAAAGSPATQANVTALPMPSETAVATIDVHQTIGPTAVQTPPNANELHASTPTKAVRSMTSGPEDFSPAKSSRAMTSDHPLSLKDPLSSWPLHSRFDDCSMKLVGAPKDRIREIVNQLGQKRI
eukprot:TRINITY_DN65655_c0_g1_i1.p1 TRINITY_DN65655_c0_g1~~TRINITY_DN65655_c0_g1_i1.p1  ORF type:complete len:395 (+),score=76.10 TRINITY_DN65655_c0_g1_i1:59-1243(+)